MTATSPWTGARAEQAGSLSERELRAEPGRVLRAVREGGAFVLTDHGVPVGRIVPLDAPPPSLAITRPAIRDGGWADLGIVRKKGVHTLPETLDDMRQERTGTVGGDHDRLR